MRRIVLDTETTGLEPAEGHRIIEVACLELSGRRATGTPFPPLREPERAVDFGATQVHGLTAEDLADKPASPTSPTSSSSSSRGASS
jgi:DNA polymerase-3 subunit epsilon